MKYTVLTFGCRVNQADSLGFEEDLLRQGAEPAPLDQADLVVVNTCSVTASADQAARQSIRRVSRVNPTAKVVVTGCYATRRPADVSALPNVVRVVANADKSRLIPLVLSEPGRSGMTSAERFGDGHGACGLQLQPGVAGRTAFTLRVQTGCSQPCSYCIIPTTRGAPESVAIETIVGELRRVRAAGFKEVALTGVHLGSYGRDMALPRSLLDLLLALEREPGVLFRLSSLEPMDCTADIVDLVARSDRFAPHFHLPLQHASNRMLTAMRRPYTFEHYRDLVGNIRQRLPHASIGTDLIVGFPGETGDDFEELRSWLATSPLTHAHVFPYSDRPGTPAAALTGKVEAPVVRERARELREIAHALSASFRASQVGAVYRALTLEDGTLALTGNYLKVRIPPGHARNEWTTIRIERSDSALSGTVVD
jgi:threonylcarbamoyladenosine tRNA methylthiotransferase MtaB